MRKRWYAMAERVLRWLAWQIEMVVFSLEWRADEYMQRKDETPEETRLRHKLAKDAAMAWRNLAEIVSALAEQE